MARTSLFKKAADARATTMERVSALIAELRALAANAAAPASAAAAPLRALKVRAPSLPTPRLLKRPIKHAFPYAFLCLSYAAPRQVALTELAFMKAANGAEGADVAELTLARTWRKERTRTRTRERREREERTRARTRENSEREERARERRESERKASCEGAERERGRRERGGERWKESEGSKRGQRAREREQGKRARGTRNQRGLREDEQHERGESVTRRGTGEDEERMEERARPAPAAFLDFPSHILAGRSWLWCAWNRGCAGDRSAVERARRQRCRV